MKHFFPCLASTNKVRNGTESFVLREPGMAAAAVPQKRNVYVLRAITWHATGYVSDVPFKTTSVTDHGIIERSHETESYTLQK